MDAMGTGTYAETTVSKRTEKRKWKMNAQTMMKAIGLRDGLQDLVPETIVAVPVELDLRIR